MAKTITNQKPLSLDTPLCKGGEVAQHLMLRATAEIEGISGMMMRVADEIRQGDFDVMSHELTEGLYSIRGHAARIHELNSMMMSEVGMDDGFKLRDASMVIYCDASHRELCAALEMANDVENRDE